MSIISKVNIKLATFSVDTNTPSYLNELELSFIHHAMRSRLRSEVVHVELQALSANCIPYVFPYLVVASLLDVSGCSK